LRTTPWHEKRKDEFYEKFFVWEFFDFATDGFFVEVGAFHSQELSQTWMLEKLGWSGMLVEPIPENADELRLNRPRSVVHQVALTSYEKAGTLKLHIAGEAGSQSGLIKNQQDAERKYQRNITVTATTFDSILGAEPRERIDFVSIDTEGNELDVLRGFDFSKHRPRLILVEDVVLDLKLHNFLASKGYRLLRRTQWNNWYVPQDCPRHPAFLERVRLFRKMYIGTPFRAWKYRHKRQAVSSS
jgi:FkbM family methyltransferase